MDQHIKIYRNKNRELSFFSFNHDFLWGLSSVPYHLIKTFSCFGGGKNISKNGNHRLVPSGIDFWLIAILLQAFNSGILSDYCEGQKPEILSSCFTLLNNSFKAKLVFWHTGITETQKENKWNWNLEVGEVSGEK